MPYVELRSMRSSMPSGVEKPRHLGRSQMKRDSKEVVNFRRTNLSRYATAIIRLNEGEGNLRAFMVYQTRDEYRP